MDQLQFSLPSWWLLPDAPPARIWQFLGVLAFVVGLRVLISPNRRRIMGTGLFALAIATIYFFPLSGVIVVRSGYRHAYLAQGKDFWTALWLSFLWMAAYILVGGVLIRILPPTSWLIRRLSHANREGFKALIGLGGKRA